jgi:hypothetical protein
MPDATAVDAPVGGLADRLGGNLRMERFEPGVTEQHLGRPSRPQPHSQGLAEKSGKLTAVMAQAGDSRQHKTARR